MLDVLGAKLRDLFQENQGVWCYGFDRFNYLRSYRCRNALKARDGSVFGNSSLELLSGFCHEWAAVELAIKVLKVVEESVSAESLSVISCVF